MDAAQVQQPEAPPIQAVVAPNATPGRGMVLRPNVPQWQREQQTPVAQDRKVPTDITAVYDEAILEKTTLPNVHPVVRAQRALKRVIGKGSELPEHATPKQAEIAQNKQAMREKLESLVPQEAERAQGETNVVFDSQTDAAIVNELIDIRDSINSLLKAQGGNQEIAALLQTINSFLGRPDDSDSISGRATIIETVRNARVERHSDKYLARGRRIIEGGTGRADAQETRDTQRLYDDDYRAMHNSSQRVQGLMLLQTHMVILAAGRGQMADAQLPAAGAPQQPGTPAGGRAESAYANQFGLRTGRDTATEIARLNDVRRRAYISMGVDIPPNNDLVDLNFTILDPANETNNPHMINFMGELRGELSKLTQAEHVDYATAGVAKQTELFIRASNEVYRRRYDDDMSKIVTEQVNRDATQRTADQKSIHTIATEWRTGKKMQQNVSEADVRTAEQQINAADIPPEHLRMADMLDRIDHLNTVGANGNEPNARFNNVIQRIWAGEQPANFEDWQKLLLGADITSTPELRAWGQRAMSRTIMLTTAAQVFHVNQDVWGYTNGVDNLTHLTTLAAQAEPILHQEQQLREEFQLLDPLAQQAMLGNPGITPEQAQRHTELEPLIQTLDQYHSLADQLFTRIQNRLVTNRMDAIEYVLELTGDLRERATHGDNPFQPPESPYHPEGGTNHAQGPDGSASFDGPERQAGAETHHGRIAFQSHGDFAVGTRRVNVPYSVDVEILRPEGAPTNTLRGTIELQLTEDVWRVLPDVINIPIIGGPITLAAVPQPLINEVYMVNPANPAQAIKRVFNTIPTRNTMIRETGTFDTLGNFRNTLMTRWGSVDAQKRNKLDRTIGHLAGELTEETRQDRLTQFNPVNINALFLGNTDVFFNPAERELYVNGALTGGVLMAYRELATNFDQNYIVNQLALPANAALNPLQQTDLNQARDRFFATTGQELLAALRRY